MWIIHAYIYIIIYGADSIYRSLMQYEYINIVINNNMNIKFEVQVEVNNITIYLFSILGARVAPPTRQ